MSPWNSRKVRSWSCGAAMLALCGHPCSAWASPTAGARRVAVASPATPLAADVELKRSGPWHGQILQGQVVNDAGTGVAAATVELTDGRQVWQTKSDGQGCFQLTGLRGGTYQLQVAGHAQRLRAWAEGTAPPHASRGLLVTPATDLVRGQRVLSPNTNQFFRVAKQRLANPLVVGGVILTAVAIPVAIHNADDDDQPATP